MFILATIIIAPAALRSANTTMSAVNFLPIGAVRGASFPCPVMGYPHRGQEIALSEISFLHSGHFINAIYASPLNPKRKELKTYGAANHDDFTVFAFHNTTKNSLNRPAIRYNLHIRRTMEIGRKGLEDERIAMDSYSVGCAGRF